MKKNSTIVLGVIGIISVIGILWLLLTNPKKPHPIELSEHEKIGLVQMREEEKLARDVYLTLGSIWGTRIFSNIASSEQIHTDAVKNLLARYAITDPVVDDSLGSFTSPKMKNLYTTLVAQGTLSLKEALVVGATIEDLDIKDLDTFKKETVQSDILSVYNNLQQGSRNHMRAFVKNIQANGGSYTPRYISPQEYDSIINSF